MKKKHKILLSILTVLLLFFLVINIIPPKKAIENNPFITEGQTMICAHRGGGANNPENSMKAFKACVYEYDVQILETDLWLTKDNQLVVSHDDSMNRTSDVEEVMGSDEEYLIEDHTLEELKQFNLGYNFEKDGNYPYRDIITDENRRLEILKENDLSIITFDELFSQFYDDHKELLFIVEIKNPGEKGYIAADIINDLLTNKYPDYINRIVVGTFHDEITDYMSNTYPYILRGASVGDATKFIVTQLLKVNIFENQTFACLQLPEKQMGINLKWRTYIRRAHRKNIAVQYWTINDEKVMRELIEKDADAIMTDNPLLLKQVLDSYK